MWSCNMSRIKLLSCLISFSNRSQWRRWRHCPLDQRAVGYKNPPYSSRRRRWYYFQKLQRWNCSSQNARLLHNLSQFNGYFKEWSSKYASILYSWGMFFVNSVIFSSLTWLWLINDQLISNYLYRLFLLSKCWKMKPTVKLMKSLINWKKNWKETSDHHANLNILSVLCR